MRRGRSVRLFGAAGTALVTVAALLGGGAALAAAGIVATAGTTGTVVTVLVVTLACWPAYATNPQRPWWRLQSAALGVAVAIGALAIAASLGVGNVPAPELLLVVGASVVATVPPLADRLHDRYGPRRVVVAGDDADKIGDAVATLDDTTVGYLSPPRLALGADGDGLGARRVRADGGVAPTDGDATGSDETTDSSEDTTGDADDATGDDATGDTDDAARSDDATHSDDSTDRSTDATDRSNDAPPERSDGGTTRGEGADAELVGRQMAVERPKNRNLGALATTERLSGLTSFSRLLAARNVDTVVLGFSESDRQEFFGALRICRALGVDAKVHESHAASTLVAATDSRAEGPDGSPELLGADVEPLPLYARVGKRAFDVCFAVAALVALAPLIALLSVAIKLDSPGPVLYGQRRTGRLGRTFTLQKFRSMVDDAEADRGPTLSDEDAGDLDPRVTRVGRVLRATHLDEIPQLLAILRGDMSVVGPRPERPELETEIVADGVDWEQRWFLQPGLTGLAQINEVTGFEPRRKLAYDLEYARRQSLLLDVRIVAVQLWMVATDAIDLLLGRGSE